MTKKTTTKETARVAALYCRVSTIDQGKADFSSLNAQEEMLREHCKSKGWIIYKAYVDTKSGKTLDRQELTKLLADAEEKQFDVVVATKLDRLSRSVKDFLELDDQFNKQGIDIVITTQNIDTTTPAGQMQRTIMMAFAQFEREMIAERTRESAYVRAQKGFWLGGNVPLGYDIIDKKLIVNTTESAVVKKIYESYLEIPSTKALARALCSEGYKAKSRTTRAGKKIGGNDLNYQHVHDILRNKIYTGVIKVNNETFKGLHDPIIDDVLFERVQQRLDKSASDRYATYEGSPLLLLGITRCGFCGKQLTTYFANNGSDPIKHYYYKCTTQAKQSQAKCPCRLVPARDIERFTQSLMVEIAHNKGFFDTLTAQIKDNSDVDLLQLNEEKQKMLGNQSKIEKKISNLVGNFSDVVLSKDTKAALTEELENFGNQKKTIEQAVSEISDKIRDIEGKKFQKTGLQEIFNEFALFFGEADMDKKRAMLHTIVEEIKVMAKKGEEEGTLEFKIRGDETIVKKWSEVVNRRGVYSTPRVRSLRG